MNSQEYLDAHGLRKDFVEEEFGWLLYDDSIAIPTKDKDGNITHFCRRLLTESPNPEVKSSKFNRTEGSKPSLYAIDKVKDIEEVVYCEGQPDCVRLWQEGIPAVTSDGGAESFTDQMARQLKGKVVNLCMDSDEAGQKVVIKNYDLLSKYAKLVRIVDIPKEYKDVTEMFQAGCDADLFKKIIYDSATNSDTWLVNNMKPEYKIENLDELFAANLPKDSWIVDKVIPTVGISVFAGAAGTGKSFLSLDMARSILSEEVWLDQYKIIKKCNVLFLDKENERGNFRNRCRGLKMQGINGLYRMVYPEIFELASRERNQRFSTFALEMAAFVRAMDIGLIIFDSFVDFMSGDENSASDTQIFFDAIRELLPGRSILLLAHYTKTKEGDTRSPLERISGSRNIGAQVTSGLSIESSKEADNEIIISLIKARNTAKNTTKYKILMHSDKDPENPNETLVIGFENTGEVIEEVEKITGAIDLMTNLIDSSSGLGVRRKEAIAACVAAGIAQRTAELAISQMRKSGIFNTFEIEGSREKLLNRVANSIRNTKKDENYEN